MNTRRKGQRTHLKAVRYARSFPGVKVLGWHQPAWFATEQPFDVLVLRAGYWPRFVEVRTTQWRTGRTSTLALARLPGEGYHKQIWLFREGETSPCIRQWNGRAWVEQDAPWESLEAPWLADGSKAYGGNPPTLTNKEKQDDQITLPSTADTGEAP